MCDCNFFCKILCTIVLVIAFLFNTLGNWVGVGDIIPTESCPFEWCVEETTEEETSEDTSQEGTTKPLTEAETTTTTTAPTTTTTTATTTTTTTTRPTTTTTTTLPTTTTTRYSTTQPPETDAGPHIQTATEISLETFGGSGDDIINGAAPTSDGGYVICGTTTSQDGNFAKLYTSGWKSPYGFVAKYSKAGKLVWVKAFASTNSSINLKDITVLSNGTIIVVGYTKASDYVSNPNSFDALILKLASNGYLSAKKCIGGQNTDMFDCVEAIGNNFVAGGKTYSTIGDFAGVQSDSAIMMCFNSNLAVQWKTALHGNAASTISDIAVDGDGNIFASCITSATTGDFEEYKNSGGYADTLVLKYNSAGEKQWGYMISSTARDEFGAIAPDGKGGCVVAGSFQLASSPITDGSLSNVHHCGGIDALVFRINSNGKCRWIKTLSGLEDDFITDIVKTDGGFAVSGYSKSSNREFAEAGNEGLYDGFISFINTNGTTVKTFTNAGSDDDMAECLVYTALGNICVMGKTKSSDVDFAELNTNSNAVYIGYIGKYQIEVQ